MMDKDKLMLTAIVSHLMILFESKDVDPTSGNFFMENRDVIMDAFAHHDSVDVAGHYISECIAIIDRIKERN
jgi:hypothetical protein